MNKNQMLKMLGKVLYAVPFAVFGVLHFMNAEMMAGMVPAMIPGGVFWVYFTGLAMIAAAVSILLGKWSALATCLLGVLLLVFVFAIHLPGVLNPETMMASMPGLLKDLSLAGAAFFMSGTMKVVKND